MDAPDAPDGFIDKWRVRWPEWRVAEVFVPEPLRREAAAWFALLQEIDDAAWGGADPTPGLAKLAWWHEELKGWGKGARRHPLGEVLQRRPAPWTGLARALNTLPATRGQAAEAALSAIADLAAAVAECELVLFATEQADTRSGAGEAVTSSAGAALGLLGGRALQAGAHEEAAWLLRQWPERVAGPRPRRIHAALLRARLQALAAGKGVRPLPAWRVLPVSWRAARRGD